MRFKKARNTGLRNTKILASVLLAATTVVMTSFGLLLALQSDWDSTMFLTSHSPDDMVAVPNISDAWYAFGIMQYTQWVVPAFAQAVDSPPVVTGLPTSFVAVNEGQTLTFTPTVTYNGTDTLIYHWHQQEFDFITDTDSISTTFTLPQVDKDEVEFIFFDVYYDDDNEHVYVRSYLFLDIRNVGGSPPVVDVGSDQTVDEGMLVNIPWTVTNGTTYQWSDDSSFTITYNNPNSSPTTLTAPQVSSDTTVTITLTATNDDGSGTDSMQLTILDVPAANNSPVAEAGPNQEVDERGFITLQGSGSDDDGDSLTYSWSQHPEISFDNQTSPTPTITTSSVTSDTTITVTLTVDDGTATGMDTMILTIRDVVTEPTVWVGPDKTVKEGGQVSIAWSASDPEDNFLSYAWSQQPTHPQITLINPDLSPTTFTAPQVDDDTTFTLTLIVTAGTDTIADSLAVTVKNNRPPAVDAGLDQTVNERDTVILSGSANDPDADDNLTYKWLQDYGTSVILTDDDTASSRFAAPGVTSDEELVFSLTVTDDSGESAEGILTVTVRDVPISVSSATYNPGNGQLRIIFNQDISSTPTYSSIHIRSAGDDSDGIPLSDVFDRSYSGRTITATLSSEQQEMYGDLQSPQIDISSGAVTDADSVLIDETSDIIIRNPLLKKLSPAAPIVDLNTLMRVEIVDIPPYISEQVASHQATDPLGHGKPDDVFDPPLVINGQGYLLDGLLNTLVPYTVAAGQSTVITFTTYTVQDLTHFTLYLNLQDNDVSYSCSDTYIRYTIDGAVTVTDPHEYIADDATITITEDSDQMPEKKTVRITIKFEESMGPTNMVAYMWDLEGRSTIIRMIDALDVVLGPDLLQEVDPEPMASPDSGLVVNPEDEQAFLLIRVWSDFEPGSVTDDLLVKFLGLDGHMGNGIPDWVMTNLGTLVSKNLVTVEEFRVALEYVLENT